MNISLTGEFYKPLIAPTDRMVKRRIPEWKHELLNELTYFSTNPEPDPARLAPTMNQLALIALFEDEPGISEDLCYAHIAILKAFANVDQVSHLCCIIQPWINIARLTRIQGKIDKAMAAYQAFAPSNRDQTVPIFSTLGNNYTLRELCKLDYGEGSLAIIDDFYWIEYGRLLFSLGKFEELYSHFTVASSENMGQFIRFSLLELLIISQLRLGKLERCLDLLAKMKLPHGHVYWLHFKALEMVTIALNQDVKNYALADELLTEIRSEQSIMPNSVRLQLLVDIGNLFNNLKYRDHEIEVFQTAYGLSKSAHDEPLEFEIMNKLMQSGHIKPESVVERFATTMYASIRKRLSLEPIDNKSQWSDIVATGLQISKLNSEKNPAESLPM